MILKNIQQLQLLTHVCVHGHFILVTPKIRKHIQTRMAFLFLLIIMMLFTCFVVDNSCTNKNTRIISFIFSHFKLEGKKSSR